MNVDVRSTIGIDSCTSACAAMWNTHSGLVSTLSQSNASAMIFFIILMKPIKLVDNFLIGLSWCVWKQRKAANTTQFSPSINKTMMQLWLNLRRVPGCCHWVADQQRQSASHFSFIEWIYARDSHSRLIVVPVFSTGYGRVRQVYSGCPQPIECNSRA